MKKRVTYIVFAFILIVFVVFYAIVDKNNKIYDRTVDTSQYVSVGLAEGESIEQTFVSEEDKLDGMTAKMSVSGQPQDKEVGYRLKDENDKVVVSGTTSLEKMKTGKFFAFKFDPVTNCKGKKYTFELTVNRCAAEEQVIVYWVPGSEKNAELLVNGEREDGVMALRAVTHRFDLETFIVTAVFLIYVLLFIRWLGKIFK